MWALIRDHRGRIAVVFLAVVGLFWLFIGWRIQEAVPLIFGLFFITPVLALLGIHATRWVSRLFPAAPPPAKPAEEGEEEEEEKKPEPGGARRRPAATEEPPPKAG